MRNVRRNTRLAAACVACGLLLGAAVILAAVLRLRLPPEPSPPTPRERLSFQRLIDEWLAPAGFPLGEGLRSPKQYAAVADAEGDLQRVLLDVLLDPDEAEEVKEAALTVVIYVTNDDFILRLAEAVLIPVQGSPRAEPSGHRLARVTVWGCLLRTDLPAETILPLAEHAFDPGHDWLERLRECAAANPREVFTENDQPWLSWAEKRVARARELVALIDRTEGEGRDVK
jgi:hypothetical protein